MSGGGNFQGNQGAGGWQPPAGMPGSSGMGSGGTGAWGGNYNQQTGPRRPGFMPGGPNDPAMGGSGYMGSLGTGPTQGWAGPGGGSGPIPEGAIGFGTSCFIDGVQVELVDGSEKNVSEINIGDEVKTDKGDGVVTKVYPSKAGGQKLYGFNDKEPFVTEAHPFMTQDGWKKISEVSKGDTLYRNGKGDVTVESITAKEIPEDTPVYNFHVDGHETYFADGYLVHNKTYAPGYEPGGENFVPGTGPQSGWAWPGGGYNNTPPRYPGMGGNVQNPGMPGGGKYPRYPGMGGTDPDIIGPITEGGWNHNPRGFAHADRGSNFGKAANWAGQGKMGRAKQAIEAGGGTWGKDMHRFLKNRPRKMVINN